MRCIGWQTVPEASWMFACNFPMFSESRLWEYRVFTMLADRQVRFDSIFTRFADNRLWEYRIFSFQNKCLPQKSRVFAWTFHLFLLLEALQGFERLWEVLEVFERLWDGLEGFGRLCRLCEVL